MTYYAGVIENNVSLMSCHVVTLAWLAYNAACAILLDGSDLAYSTNMRGMRSDRVCVSPCLACVVTKIYRESASLA